MSTAIRLGTVILPDEPWKVSRDHWREAEDLGFDHAWTYDHLTWRDLREKAWFSALPVLTAAALETTSLRVGTLVASANFRHPVSFAKELMTLDEISEGRLTLGFGAGGGGFDSTALGQEQWSAQERASRFEEFVTLLDQVLVNPVTPEFRGEFYSAHEARSIPGCTQQPRIPFVIAGTGNRGISLAAKFGSGWVSNGDSSNPLEATEQEHFMSVQKQISMLRDECARIGRDFDSIDRVFLASSRNEAWMKSVSEFERLANMYQEIGFTDIVIHRPRNTQPFAGDLDVYRAIAKLSH
jgi:alkanesulfonate monooxygenase SsuD/methylene tetrahydromethanopterin reductase-like flavin-dependent oxidoreductase (luciferase family)